MAFSTVFCDRCAEALVAIFDHRQTASFDDGVNGIGIYALATIRKRQLGSRRDS
jgi:hypothetical protein